MRSGRRGASRRNRRSWFRVQGDTISVERPRKLDPAKDPLLRDIVLEPGRSKVKVTKKLLDKLEEEAWTP